MGSMGVAAEFSKITGGGVWDKVCSGVMTLAILIASEIIPKNLGARYWKKWAPWVGTSLHWLTWIMTRAGIVKAISFFSRGGHHSESFNRQELRVMAEMGFTEGKLNERESGLLANVLKLNRMKIEDVMTPRVVILSIDESTTIGDFLRQHRYRQGE